MADYQPALPGIPKYTRWDQVPDGLHTKTDLGRMNPPRKPGTRGGGMPQGTLAPPPYRGRVRPIGSTGAGCARGGAKAAVGDREPPGGCSHAARP